MLNCTVTCRGTDKKPCDNILNLEPAGKLIGNIDFGGDAMHKFFANNTSLAKSLVAAVDHRFRSTNTRHPHIQFSTFCAVSGYVSGFSAN